MATPCTVPVIAPGEHLGGWEIEDETEITTMSKSAPERPSQSSGRRVIAMVASLYNGRYVDALLESARGELREILPEAALPVFRVPGAFEIPVCARYIARHARPDAIVAFGVIIRGRTAHADLVGESVTSALLALATGEELPVIHEVLLLDSEEQAEERCFGEGLNRGVEAARAAANMVELFHKLRATYPPRRGGDGN